MCLKALKLEFFVLDFVVVDVGNVIKHEAKQKKRGIF